MCLCFLPHISSLELSVNFGRLFALSLCFTCIATHILLSAAATQKKNTTTTTPREREREWERFVILGAQHMELLNWNRHIAFPMYYIIIVSNGGSARHRVHSVHVCALVFVIKIQQSSDVVILLGLWITRKMYTYVVIKPSMTRKKNGQ